MLERDVENGLLRLAGTGGKIGVAVSGGADSVALGILCASFGAKYGREVVFLHFEHGIRGEESLRDMDFVKNLASKLHIECACERADAPAEAAKTGESLEAVARRMRYEFFERTAEKLGLSKIAIAHHLDDLSETMIMNIIRGGGIEGMTAMKETRGDMFIRPMLYNTRADVMDFLERHRFPFVYDSSNDDVNYTRNRVRKEIMPKLAEINPAVREALLRTYRILSAEGEALEEYTARAYEKIAFERDEAVDINIDGLFEQPLAIRRRIIRRALYVIGCIIDVELGNIDTILDIAEKRETGKRTEKSDYIASVSYDTLKIRAKSYILNEYGVFGEMPIEKAADIVPSKLPAKFPEEGEFTQYVEKSAIEGAVLRTRKNGDIIRPFGMKGTKKLGDWFTDRKIPAEKRDRIPVVAKGDTILWVVGCGLSEDARAKKEPVKVTVKRRAVKRK